MVDKSVAVGMKHQSLEIHYTIEEEALVGLPWDGRIHMLNRMCQLVDVCRAGGAIFVNRNIAYGDAIRHGGFLGAVMECIASVGRLRNLTFDALEVDLARNKEGLRDTLLDLHNYSAIALMMLEENNIKGEPIDEQYD